MSKKKLTPIKTEKDFAKAIAHSCQLAEERLNDEQTNRPDPLTDELIQACQEGDYDQVKTLLQAGANPNVVRTSGSALCCAMRSLYPIEVIQLLIAAGADLNLEESPGWTPLCCAVGNDRADAIRLLVDSGANIHGQCTVNGWTALMTAASSGNVNCAIELLALGADIMIKSEDGLTALDIAKGNGRAQVIQVFSKYIEVMSLR